MTEALARGVRMGLDPGDARIGVASSDPDGSLATPVETVPRGEGDIARLAELAAELEVVRIYIGLPRSLSGHEGPAAVRARDFAQDVADRVAPIPVHLQDERLTTVSAEAMLRERGRKGQKRRQVVDQAAAVLILQSALDRERATGSITGERVHATERN